MKDQWLGNNVDLNLLSQRVEQFFIENRFETKLEQTHGKYRIEALDPQLKITVNICGQPNDFTVEFLPNKKTGGFASLTMIIGYITSVFGGGAFMLRDIKTQEALNILTQIFWEHVDRQVAELTNSAKQS